VSGVKIVPIFVTLSPSNSPLKGIFLTEICKLFMTEEIKKRIRQLGLKKSHVADKIGASQSELSHFLSGRRSLDQNKLFMLKKYLDIRG
jgi:predicted XRE-type DNA-binding protein